MNSQINVSGYLTFDYCSSVSKGALKNVITSIDIRKIFIIFVPY